MRKLLLVLCTVALALPLARTATGANVPDHLLCYDVNDKLDPNIKVDLPADAQPEFRQLGCTVGKVTKFCVPTVKNVITTPPPSGPTIDAPPLVTDYVCYQLDCPTTNQALKDTQKVVADQFGPRPENKFQHPELCVPAIKRQPPCHQVSANSRKCAGVCPNDPTGVGMKCVFDPTITAGDPCRCEGGPCGGKPPKGGACGGDCTAAGAGFVCQQPIAGGDCTCGPPLTPPCSLLPGLAAAGSCGGTCPPGETCELVTDTANMVVDCKCQPPVPTCSGQAPQCAGPCPPGLTCISDPATTECRCESVCGLVGGACGGPCPPGLGCTLDAAGQSCSCQPPAECGPNSSGQCGGACPPGSTCVTLASAPNTCACAP